MAAVDGNIETARNVVMEGFEDSLMEGDTGECVWCKNWVE